MSSSATNPNPTATIVEGAASAPKSSKKGTKSNLLTRTYLATYNAAQLIIWSRIAFKAVEALVVKGETNAANILSDKTTEAFLKLGLYGCGLEIINAAAGLVRSPVGTTSLQVTIRSLVYALSLASDVKGVRDKPASLQLLLAWGLSEPIRYAFYLAGLVMPSSKATKKEGGEHAQNAPAAVPKWLSWLRYSAFIVLYPIGVTDEMLCLCNALPFLRESGKFSIALPNKMNFAFHTPSVIGVALAVAYIPGWWSMYSYMFSQRRKVLGGAKEQKNKAE